MGWSRQVPPARVRDCRWRGLAPLVKVWITKASLSVPQRSETVPPFLETIVHPTDFSSASERAFAHALAVALVRRARLTLLHVGTEPHADWTGFPTVRAVLERWGLLEPGSSRAAVFEKLGVRVTKRGIPSHSPAAAVVEYLHGTPADLLVVATEGRDGVARWLHGSVAETMARRSKTMTLFVPAHSERSIVSLADGNLTLKNVLIPVDREPDTSEAVEFARRAAEI
ncbi:MAG TPA: universal stress protein, partial [Vicinamibacterales bacterium]